MKHNCKEMKSLLAEAEKLGCRIEVKRSGVIKVLPPQHLHMGFRTVHMGERGLHPLRRFVRNVRLAAER